MRRYQVYLDPHSVSILDDIEEETRISRSKIIRETVDRVAHSLTKVIAPTKTSKKKYILDTLVGSISMKGNKRTNFASKTDDIYLQD